MPIHKSTGVPVLAAMQPLFANPGEVLTLSGENLTPLVRVEIGGAPAVVVQGNSQTIQVYVPENAKSGQVKVVTINGETTFKEEFILAKDKLTLQVAPLNGLPGDKLLLSGPEFDPVLANNVVKIGGITARVLALKDKQLEVEVPAGVTSSFLTLRVGERLFVSPEQFRVDNTPLINKISPGEGFPGMLITLEGSGFGDKGLEVLFNGVGAVIESQTSTLLVVEVPKDASTGTISVQTARYKVFSPTIFQIKDGPSVTQILPDAAEVSQVIQIVGKNFHTLGPDAYIRFSGGATANILE
ncbi:MAG TPA: IPT/TIG domain-containing protein, partial [bacterium]|nr:IPT/TIG domain-containing protein [bacterium]